MGDEKKEKLVIHGNDRAGMELTYDGLYDFEELMGAIQDWYGTYRYDVILKEHSEKVGSDGKEIKVELVGFRKVTEYVLFRITVLIDILRQVDVVVDYRGKQVKQQRGEIVIRIKSELEKNWNKMFKSQHNFLRQHYEKYIVKQTLSSYKDKLTKEGDSFINVFKQHFAQNR